MSASGTSKRSHPPPTSVADRPSWSRKKRRIVSASCVKKVTCNPLIIARLLDVGAATTGRGSVREVALPAYSTGPHSHGTTPNRPFRAGRPEAVFAAPWPPSHTTGLNHGDVQTTDGG